jgi:internalin A
VRTDAAITIALVIWEGAEARTRLPPDTRGLTLVCRLSKPAPGLVPWLTVRHHRASTGKHWRRGVFLRHPTTAYASEALLELRRPDELVIQVRAPSPDLYFNVLRESVEDLITSRWPGLSYRLFVPCPGKVTATSGCPGLFPLDGLLRLRERGSSTFPCIDCAQTHDISVLLTGFTAPDRSLTTEMRQILEQLANVSDGMVRIEGKVAEVADSVRRVLRVVSTEVTDCPSLFTLAHDAHARGERLRFVQRRYRLTLWCEHPGHWHPWVPASYELSLPKEWFKKVAPYVWLIFRILQIMVPLAGSIAVSSLPREQIESAAAHLDMMKTVVDDVQLYLDQDRVDATQPSDKLTVAEGEALRALRVVIFEHDQLRAFGGLRRAQAPSGEFVWICDEHYREYDPGLPTVP